MVYLSVDSAKSFNIAYSLYYTKSHNESTRHISASLRPSNTASFEEM